MLDNSGPAAHAQLITTPGTTVFLAPSRGIWIGGAGNVNIVTEGGETVLFSGVPAGTLLPVRAMGILAASTTATLIVIVW